MPIHPITEGVPDVSLSSIQMWHENATRLQREGIRTDSRRSSSPVTAARIAIRQFAHETATACANKAIENGIRKDEADRDRFAAEITEAIAFGLGYSERDGEIRCDSLRTDGSWFAPGALTVSDGPLIRPAYAPRVLSSAIPTRTVAAWAEQYRVGAMNYAGKMAPYQPGRNQYPYADVQTNYRQRPMHSFVTATRLDFYESMVSAQADVSVVQEKAEAARIAEAEWRESALVNGVSGLDFTGLKQLGATNYYSDVNYSTESNMDVMYADLMRAVQSIAEAAGDRGTGPNAALIGTRWARALMRKSNFNAGGMANGNNLLGAIAMTNAALGTTLAQAGITSIMSCPSLNGFGGSDRDGMLMFDQNNDRALRQVVAMTIAPVRTHENLTATETLWMCRHGGLDLADALPIGLATAKVVS